MAASYFIQHFVFTAASVSNGSVDRIMPTDGQDVDSKVKAQGEDDLTITDVCRTHKLGICPTRRMT